MVADCVHMHRVVVEVQIIMVADWMHMHKVLEHDYTTTKVFVGG